jgi:nuclear cap-binding protein subunit 1
MKIPIVSAVVLYANAVKRETAEKVIAQAGLDLQQAIDAGDWSSTKLLLRFLASSTQLFESDGMMVILDDLFDRAVDLQTASSEDVCSAQSRPRVIKSNACYRLSALSSSRSSY